MAIMDGIEKFITELIVAKSAWDKGICKMCESKLNCPINLFLDPIQLVYYAYEIPNKLTTVELSK